MGFFRRLAKQVATRAIDIALKRMLPLDLVQSNRQSDSDRQIKKEEPERRGVVRAPKIPEANPSMPDTLNPEPPPQQGQLNFSSDEERWKAVVDGRLVLSTRADEKSPEKKESGDAEAKPLAEVIRLSAPTNQSHVLTALPVVRHWLFAPDRTTLRYREFEHQTQVCGKDITQKICIGDKVAAAGKGYGVLTTRHQQGLLAIQHIWQIQGGRLVNLNSKRFGTVSCSSWQLEEALFGSHGGRQVQLVRQVVQEVASIPVKIENYVDHDGHLATLDLTGFIHGRFASSRRVSEGPWVEMLIDPLLVTSFERNEVKPIDLEILRGFNSDIAALLYPKIDYMLASHERTELRLDGLVKKLGLTAKRLREKSYRHSKFEGSVNELNGKALSHGGELVVRLEPTADGEDFKIVAEKR